VNKGIVLLSAHVVTEKLKITFHRLAQPAYLLNLVNPKADLIRECLPGYATPVGPPALIIAKEITYLIGSREHLKNSLKLIQIQD
jgi:hypothetical protein